MLLDTALDVSKNFDSQSYFEKNFVKVHPSLLKEWGLDTTLAQEGALRRIVIRILDLYLKGRM